MDPDLASAVADAVAAGAVAGAKDTATAAVKDSYAALKALLARHRVDVAGLERRPNSVDKRGSLREDLEDLPDADDRDDLADRDDFTGNDRVGVGGPGVGEQQIVEAAKRVVDAVAEYDATVAEVVGVDLSRVRARFLRVRDVRSDGTGVRVRDADIAGGVEVTGIRAGPQTGRDGDRPDGLNQPGPPRR